MEENETKSVSFKDIGNLIKLNWLFIVIVLALSIAISGAYACFVQKTNYTASVMLEVGVKETGSEDNVSESSIYSFARYLAKGYKVLLSNDDYINRYNKYVDNYNNTNVNGPKLTKIDADAIEFTIDDDLDVLFSVSYTVADKGSDPEEISLEVSRTLNEYIDYVKGIIDDNDVSIYSKRLTVISKADVNNVKVSKGTLKTILIGFVIGLAVACVVLFIKFISDDSLFDKNEVEKVTGAPVIAIIPVVNENSKKGLFKKGAKEKSGVN